MVGRPRGIEDAVILRAAAEVIGRVGPMGLTLSLVAREVGLVPGTLAQRFGSKRGLLLALAEQSAKEAEELPGSLRRERYGSPLAALEVLVVEPMAQMATPEAYANHLAFLCIDLTDPEFRQHALAIHQAQSRAISSLLAEALAAGGLRVGTDIAALTESIQAIAAGAGLIWALDRQGTLAQRLKNNLDKVLVPHLSEES